MKLLRSAFIILPGIFIFAACNNATRNENAVDEGKKIPVETIKTPPFSSDSAYAFVKAQVDFGPRVNNTKAHEKCGDYLVKKLKQYCNDVTVQKGKVKAFNGTLLDFRNIIASFNPAISDRIFLCSHWDSRPFADHDPDLKKHNTPIDGANDGASGVGILLEVARQLSLAKPAIGVDILFLDAEDYGPPEDRKWMEDTTDWWALGSQYWAKNPHKVNYSARFGILLDMVGAPHATFRTEAFSMQYAPWVVKNVWNIAGKIGFSDYFLFEPGGAITDDHVAINKIMNIPTIDIIHLVKDSSFYHTWHTTGDNLKSIDKTTLDVVGKTLMAVIASEK